MSPGMPLIDDFLDDDGREWCGLFGGRLGCAGLGCRCSSCRRVNGGDGSDFLDRFFLTRLGGRFSHYLPLKPSNTSENDGWFSCEILTRAASMITGMG